MWSAAPRLSVGIIRENVASSLTRLYAGCLPAALSTFPVLEPRLGQLGSRSFTPFWQPTLCESPWPPRSLSSLLLYTPAIGPLAIDASQIWFNPFPLGLVTGSGPLPPAPLDTSPTPSPPSGSTQQTAQLGPRQL